MNDHRPVVGLSAIDAGNLWVGGRYYLHHLVRSVASLPVEERVDFVDVWWERAAESFDPFAEVRDLFVGRRVVGLPASLSGRLMRKVRRAVHRWHDSRDLFHDAGIDALFPIAPCVSPGVPLLFWIPDFQQARMPHLFTPELRESFDRRINDNARAADLIVLSSLDGLRDLEHFLPAEAAKGRVVPFCSPPTPEWWNRDPAGAAEALGLPERFVVVSNQFSAQKNHLMLFEAVQILRDRGTEITLACTGSTYGFHGEEYFASIEKFLDLHSLRGSIRVLGLLDRDIQIALMRRSLAMMQPSRFEGWSTVVEDAKSLGKPILVSDLAVHREQLPGLATLLPLDDPPAWADAIESIWKSRTPGPHLEEEARGAVYVEKAMRDFGRRFTAAVREAIDDR